MVNSFFVQSVVEKISKIYNRMSYQQIRIEKLLRSNLKTTSQISFRFEWDYNKKYQLLNKKNQNRYTQKDEPSSFQKSVNIKK